MRIIYMGTPEFAAIALSAIVKEHEVVAVVTQPDKPQGRNRKLVPTPVKVKAQEYEIPVYQPEKVREAEMVETLRSYKPDAIVVAAYGQILPESILSIPPYGVSTFMRHCFRNTVAQHQLSVQSSTERR